MILSFQSIWKQNHHRPTQKKTRQHYTGCAATVAYSIWWLLYMIMHQERMQMIFGKHFTWVLTIFIMPRLPSLRSSATARCHHSQLHCVSCASSMLYLSAATTSAAPDRYVQTMWFLFNLLLFLSSCLVDLFICRFLLCMSRVLGLKPFICFLYQSIVELLCVLPPFHWEYNSNFFQID